MPGVITELFHGPSVVAYEGACPIHSSHLHDDIRLTVHTDLAAYLLPRYIPCSSFRITGACWHTRQPYIRPASQRLPYIDTP
jgi:hypothetical protein